MSAVEPPHNLGEAVRRLRAKWGALLAFGVLLMGLGVVSLAFAFFSTIAMVTMNGVLLLVAGAAEVGVGVRADPDRAEVRLLDAGGAVLGEGAAMLRRLPAGRYLLEARLPANAPPAIIRPAVVGIAPRPSGPPPEVARTYLELVGLAPKDPAP